MHCVFSGSDSRSKWWLLCSLLHPTTKHLNHLRFIYIYQTLFSKATYSTFRLYILCQYVCSLGIKPTTFSAANAMLYHNALPPVIHSCLHLLRRWNNGRLFTVHSERVCDKTPASINNSGRGLSVWHHKAKHLRTAWLEKGIYHLSG